VLDVGGPSAHAACRPRYLDELQTVAFLLADLGVTMTHSRPHVSNDNPYSESQFRTLKYRPEFPARFGCVPVEYKTMMTPHRSAITATVAESGGGTRELEISMKNPELGSFSGIKCSL
jgi:transposase InsO family protein